MGSFAAAAPPFAPDDDVVNKYTTAIANDDARATRLLHGLRRSYKLPRNRMNRVEALEGAFGTVRGVKLRTRLSSGSVLIVCSPREDRRLVFHERG